MGRRDLCGFCQGQRILCQPHTGTDTPGCSPPLLRGSAQATAPRTAPPPGKASSWHPPRTDPPSLLRGSGGGSLACRSSRALSWQVRPRSCQQEAGNAVRAAPPAEPAWAHCPCGSAQHLPASRLRGLLNHREKGLVGQFSAALLGWDHARVSQRVPSPRCPQP